MLRKGWSMQGRKEMRGKQTSFFRRGYARVAEIAYLPMRYSPSYDSSVKHIVPKGVIVKLLSGPYAGQWYKTAYRGWVGYQLFRWLVDTGLTGYAIARKYHQVVVVSLAHQQLEAYQNGRLILITAITSGKPQLPTPTGISRVTAKFSPFLMVSPWPKGTAHYFRHIPMNYAVCFRWPDYYLHHAPRRPYFGYGTNLAHLDPDGVWRKGSHGCVNMPLWSAARLYHWIRIGTAIHVVEE